MKPTQETLYRIDNLADPKTLDRLLAVFESVGMPMGSDRWAEYCITLIRQWESESIALRMIMHKIAEVQTIRDNAGDKVWIGRRKQFTKEFQDKMLKQEQDGPDTR